MTTRNIVRVYLVTIAALVTAMLLRWLLDPWLGDRLTLATLYGAVAVAVWVGGYRPAIFATVLGYLACDWLFIAPRGQFGLDNLQDVLGLMAYLLSCAIIIYFGETMRRARQRAEASLEQLQQEIAQRQQAEETLRLRNEEIERLLEVLPAAIWVAHDPECQTVTDNHYAERLCGVSSDTNLPVTPAHAEQNGRPPFYALTTGGIPLQSTIATGKGLENIECDLALPDGRTINLLCNTVPLHDVKGQVRGAVAACLDVSALKSAKLQIQENEERLAVALGANNLGMWEWDIVTGQGRVTPENQRIFGLPENILQPAADDYRRLIHPDDADQVARTFLATAEGGESFDVEYRIRRANDGAERWVRSTGTLVQIENGHARLLGISRDITERKQATEDLRERENHLQLVMDNTPALISYIDAECRYRFMNRQYELWFGHSRAETNGRTMTEVLGTAAVEVLRPYIEAVLRGEDVHFETETPYRKGGTRWIEAQYVPDKDQQGQVRGFFVFVQDVTERKRSEERYRGLFTSMQEGLLISELIEGNSDTGIDFRYLDINPAAERIIGLKREQVVGQTARAIIPNVREDLLQMYAHVARTGEPLHHEVYEPLLNQHHENFAFRPAPGQVAVLFWDITERKRAETALRESEERFRLATNAGTVGVWDWNIVSNTISWSESLYEIHGIKPEDFDGTVEAFAALIHPDDRAFVQAAIQRTLQSDEPYELEFRALRPDGVIIWISTQAKVMRDASGAPVRLLGGTVDITRRKQAEAANAQLAAIVESSEDAIYTYDFTGTILNWNQGAQKLYGWSATEIIGQSVTMLIPPDRLTEAPGYIIPAIQRGESIANLETVRQRRDKSVFDAVLAASPVRDAAGRTVAVSIIVRDITERNRAAAALRESEQRLRAFLENSAIVAWLKDEAGRHVFLSTNFERRFGVRSADWLGKTDFELWPRETAESFRRNDLAVLAADQPVEVIETTTDKDGNETWWLTHKFSFRDAAGQRFVGGLAVDITERQRAEVALFESEVRFRLASDAAAALVYDIDLSGARPVIVHGLERVTGYPSEKITLTSDWWHSLIHPADLPAHLEMLKRQFETGGSYVAVYRIRRQDGAWIWVQDTAQVIKDETDTAIQLVGAIVDITERKQAEAALAETANSLARERERLAVALRAGQLGVYEWRVGDPIVWWSPEVYPLYGVEPEFFNPTLEAFSALVHPDDREALWRKTQECLERRELFTHEYRIVRPDGKVRWITNVSQVGLATTGQVERITGVAVDITERKQAEQSLRESEERFAKAFNASPLSLTISSLNTGKLVEVNETFVNITGYSREEALGRTTIELGLWAKLQDRTAEMNLVRELGQVRDADYVFKRRNGEEIIGRLSAERIEIGGEPCALTVIQDVTDRKRAELALRESEERFAKAFQASPHLMTISTLAEGRYVDVNESVLRSTGYTREEIIGHLADELGIFPDPEGRAALVNAFNEQGSVRDLEIKIRAKDGRISIILLSAEIITLNGVPCILTTSNDITERKRVEEALRESEQRFKTMADTAPAMLWITDPDGAATFLSRGWYEYTSQTEEQALGFGWLEATHPDDRARSSRIFLEANTQHEPFEMDYRLRHTNSEYRWVIDAGRPRFSPEGEFLGFIGSVIDIHERRQAEEEAQRLAAIIEATPDFVAIGGMDGEMVYLNQAGRRMLDLPPEAELSEFSRLSFSPPWVLERTAQEWLPAALRDGSAVGEGALLTLAGQEIPVSFVLNVHRNAAGEPVLLSTVARDITTQRQAMAEEQRLREVAEAHNRAKDDFLAVVSHELRSPLNAILGYTRITRVNPHNAAVVERNCEIVERNARTQLQLIEDLLDTARIISGKLKLEMAPSDLRLVLEEAVEVVRPAAEIKRIELVTQLGGAPQKLLCDATRLRQIVWNLLQNAVKFTPDGGRVELRVEQAGPRVRLIVSDTGRGIEPEFLSSVFDRFSQSDMSRTRRHGGLGLGLALVKQLVELHGGTIEAASAGAACGATFTVTLPLSVPPTVSYLPAVSAIAEDNREAEIPLLEELPRLDGLRLLVVDDQEEARQMIAETLSECGATITSVASGREALSLLERMTFDALICDIAMPEMDGYEVVMQLRALEEARALPLKSHLPAIALTALVHYQERLQALNAGFQMHVAKPVDPEELVIVVASLTSSLHKNAGH